MASDMIAPLHDRGVVSITGADAAKLLQGLITNDMGALDRIGVAIHTGLLSPQGKILFDFFIVRTADGFLVDVLRDKATDLIKRLTLYKLRADVRLQDVSPVFSVTALWGTKAKSPVKLAGSVAFADPRSPMLGMRVLAPSPAPPEPAYSETERTAAQAAYDVHRIALGVPQGGKDFEFGDAYPHEADFDLFNGVSFAKGCYVGQEVVARMHNKTVVRKRVVKVNAAAPLTSGADILLGDAPVGRIGTANSANGLAMVRLDRALEARHKGILLTANGVAIKVNEAALEAYRAAAAARPAVTGLI